MTDELELKRYDTTTVDEIYDEMVPLYAETNHEVVGLPFFSVKQFAAGFVSQRAQDGFELVTARIGGKLIGVIFGFTEIPGEQFAVCELMVAIDHQRRGIAKRLHDELLRLRPEHRADLYVRKDNAPAQAAYRKWGWVKVGEIQPRADSPVLDELQLPLPLTAPPFRSAGSRSLR
jgi:ribosomal protein S18 acetylase RimI-like enzyme